MRRGASSSSGRNVRAFDFDVREGLVDSDVAGAAARGRDAERLSRPHRQRVEHVEAQSRRVLRVVPREDETVGRVAVELVLHFLDGAEAEALAEGAEGEAALAFGAAANEAEVRARHLEVRADHPGAVTHELRKHSVVDRLDAHRRRAPVVGIIVEEVQLDVARRGVI
jgi:hypothetical protein